jgi:exopolyphosphatase/pppGpp-phosphohydrolase
MNITASGVNGFSSHLRTLFAAARAQVSTPSPLVLLHIDAEQTGVAVGQTAEPAAWLALAIGAESTSREHFRHNPPSPLELENAIVTVEDEVTRARALIPAGARLVTSDALIREIALLSGVNGSGTLQLSLEAMERCFERLAQLSMGRPASSDNLPSNTPFAATLLILREFMHHLQFEAITVLPSGNHATL